jgi:low temperature requirement protein LtrA
MSSPTAAPRVPPLHVRMVPRSPHESHRVSTPLELFFDLVIVVAIAQAAAGLHHAIAEAHVAEGLLGFGMCFFAIWWAWINFTWFASAYDSDDVLYRIAVLVQMTGALIVAAGIQALFEARAPTGLGVLGYVVMRFASLSQWLRAAAADEAHRPTALRYVAGVTVVQLAWIGLVFLPHLALPGFVFLVVCELLVPAWAESVSPTTWHPHHIAERYGLFTLIVLGESVLAAMLAVQAGLKSGETLANLLPIIVGGLLIVYSMWWIYFDRPAHDLLTSSRRAFVWGYGHYFVFAAAAAVGAGLAVSVDHVTHTAHIGAIGAGYAVAIPVALFLVVLWILHYRPEHAPTKFLGPAAALVILVTPVTGMAVPLIGAILVAVVAIKVAVMHRAGHAA